MIDIDPDWSQVNIGSDKRNLPYLSCALRMKITEAVVGKVMFVNYTTTRCQYWSRDKQSGKLPVLQQKLRKLKLVQTFWVVN